MLNIFALTEAINGNASYGSTEAYNFIGSIHEAGAEFNYALMCEDADIQAFLADANELVVEAAINNPGRVDVLIENVFTQIIDAVKKFFEKIKKLVRGIIEKIRAFIARMTGKTGKWISIMRSKVEAAMKQSGSSDQTYSMHKWDMEYVNNGLLDGIDKLVSCADGRIDVLKGKGREISLDPTGLSNMMADLMTSASGDVGGAADGEDAGSKAEAREKIKNTAKEHKEHIDAGKKEFDDEFAGVAATYVGVTISGNSMEQVWNEVAKKAMGSSEKVEVKYASEFGIQKMLDAIDKTSSTTERLKKSYTDHLNRLEKLHKSWDNALSKFKVADEKDMDTTAVSEVRTLMSDYVGMATHEMTVCENTAGSARSANLKYVSDMASEFMAALTKFASYKAPKK